MANMSKILKLTLSYEIHTFPKAYCSIILYAVMQLCSNSNNSYGTYMQSWIFKTQPRSTAVGTARSTAGGTACSTAGNTAHITAGCTAYSFAGGIAHNTAGGTARSTAGGTAQSTAGVTAYSIAKWNRLYLLY